MTLEQALRAIVKTHMPTKTGEYDDVTMTVSTLLSLMRQAARAGADVEREACAEIAANGTASAIGPIATATAIRARGGK